ncbi:putative lipid II flippase FtsW [Candidatus Babeliales bacterium]|nr:putative lipid II flippase FtsW [Candidatus Babeliales bacterium]
MFIKKNKLKYDIQSFLGIIGALIIIGFLFIYSASSVYALEHLGSSHYFVKKQLVGLFLGMIAFFIARNISLNFIEIITPYTFFTSLFLTILTLVPQFSVKIHGSSRWLKLGFVTFQPSELLKIAFILYIARFLAKKHDKPFSFTGSYVPFLIIIGVTSGLLLLQPDFGLAVTLSVTAFILLFIGGFPLKHLLLTGAALLPVVGILIFKYAYRLKRILTFLNPWNDPQGAGFQIIQSLIAIGSGGWWGSGISHSKQKFFYLPMQHTDFIFSIIAEETGFVGSSLIILLFFFFLYFGLRIAWQLKNPFHIFTSLATVILISLQAIINIFVATGLLPTKGIGLPFISYGNSSLVCTLAMIGLIVNMASQEYGYKEKSFFTSIA